MRQILILGLLLCFAQIVHAKEDYGVLRTLTVSGFGEVSTVPDIVAIDITLRDEEKTASKALREVTKASDQLIAALRAAGIAQKDLVTRGLDLNRYYKNNSYSKADFMGFRAEARLSLTARNIGELGAMLDLLLDNGVDGIGMLMFRSSAAAKLQDEARQAAVADAKRKAELYAASSGVALGDLLELREADTGGSMPLMRGAIAMSADMVNPVATGNLTYSQNLIAVFDIQPIQD